MFLFNKVSVAIAGEFPLMSYSTFFSFFLFEENSAQIWGHENKQTTKTFFNGIMPAGWG